MQRCRSFASDPGAVRDARNLVAEACARQALSSDLCFVATLLTSELVTNAVLHAGTDIDLEVTFEAGRARVAVKDRSSRLPEARSGPRDATTGRGLRLVDAMASAWGAERIDTGKVVWFELIEDSGAGQLPDDRRVKAMPGAR